MLIKDLRELLGKKLDMDLSSSQKHQLKIDLRHIAQMLSEEFEIPRASLFLLKDDEKCPDVIQNYVKNI
ncbi:MAG: hypothetical protein NT085_04400 [candidate division SR1 bacterium]|nr:hypothetical protein [candidate division SR1 bacterium]